MTKISKGIRTFDLFWSIGVILIFCYLTFNSWYAYIGQPGYSQSAMLKYAILDTLCLICAIISAGLSIPRFLGWEAEDNPKVNAVLSFFVSDSERYRILAFHPIAKILPHIMLAFLIGLMVVGSEGFVQGWPIPQPFTTDSLSYSTAEKIMFQGVHPAWAEDFSILFLTNTIISIFSLIIYLIFRIDVKKNAIAFTILAFFCCIITATGYGAVVTGFASAHYNVQGDNLPFFISASIFGAMNQFLYQITGLLFPIAHFTNNTLFTLSLAVGIVFATTKASSIPVIFSKIQKRWSS